MDTDMPLRERERDEKRMRGEINGGKSGATKNTAAVGGREGRIESVHRFTGGHHYFRLAFCRPIVSGREAAD